ncbi:AEC family transporter [Zunongwangia sp.]|uniref:AEC family transporter n=1 Tax=Zunongwangia sp. TaxID=1965325 RepID=UPI003AA9D523
MFKSLYVTILPYLCCIPAGYLLNKKNIIPKSWIHKPLLFVLLPILVIDHVLEANFSNLIILAILSFALAFLMVFPAILFDKWLDNSGNINILKSGFSYFNVAFFGIPIVKALFGDKAVTTLICIYVGTAIYGNIFGYIQVAKSKLNTRKAIIEVLKIPFIYVIILALVLKGFGVQNLKAAKPVINVIGTVVSVLGMMIIGMNLTNIKFESINWKYYCKALGIRALSAIIITAGLMGLEYWLINGLQKQDRQVLALIPLFPIAANLAVFASFLKSQEKQAALLIVISMILSLILIPIGAMIFD